MNPTRFPILLTSTLIVAATALLAPADGAEPRFATGFPAPHLTVEFTVVQPCPPPARVCAPVVQAPVCAPVWIEAASGVDAHGCRTWIPGHYEQRPYGQAPRFAPRFPERRFPEPRFPAHRPAPAAHVPGHGASPFHDDDRHPGHRDDHGPAFHR